jgi:alpha-1,2-mannosyltransferase
MAPRAGPAAGAGPVPGGGPERWRGVATGLAGAIKLTPLVFVPYWWVSGQRKTAVTAAVTFAGGTSLAWLVLPSESTRFWPRELWHLNRIGDVSMVGNQSLNGALLRWDVEGASRTVLLGALGLCVITAALVRAVRAYRQHKLLAAAVIVGCAGIVVSPVSWTHHQSWLVLAALLPVSDRFRDNLGWSAFVAVVMILPVTSVHVGYIADGIASNARMILAAAIACAVPIGRRATPSYPATFGTSIPRLRLRPAPESAL